MNTENLLSSPEKITELSKSMSKENMNLLLKFMISQQEKQHELLMSESQERIFDKKIKLAGVMRSTIQEYAEASSGNKYSPMAVSSISASFASLTDSGSKVNPLDLSMFEEAGNSVKPVKEEIARLKSSPVPLDQRIKTAQDQGMRWNDHNVMPTSERTVLRKLEDWEQGIELGSQADLNTATSQEYDDLLKANSKPFMVGLCLSLEKNLDVKVPLSPYLKRRFNTLKEIYISRNGVTVGAEEVVEISLDDQVEGLYNHIFKENRTEDHWKEVKGLLRRLFINRDEDIRKIPGEILCKVVSLGVYPPTLEWRNDHERERFERCSPGVLMPDQKEYYAPQLQKLRDEYIEMAGL